MTLSKIEQPVLETQRRDHREVATVAAELTMGHSSKKEAQKSSSGCQNSESINKIVRQNLLEVFQRAANP